MRGETCTINTTVELYQVPVKICILYRVFAENREGSTRYRGCPASAGANSVDPACINSGKGGALSTLVGDLTRFAVHMSCVCDGKAGGRWLYLIAAVAAKTKSVLGKPPLLQK